MKCHLPNLLYGPGVELRWDQGRGPGTAGLGWTLLSPACLPEKQCPASHISRCAGGAQEMKYRQNSVLKL